VELARRNQPRVRVEELLAIFGDRTTKRLILHCADCRVPTNHQCQQGIRRMMVVHDWLHCGYSQPDIAAKYELSLPYVRRLITRHLNQQRRNGIEDAH
jgi:hypothetical protein